MACIHLKAKCIDSRQSDGYRRRQYQCLTCNHRWSTIEVPFNYQAGAHADGTKALIRLALLGKKQLGQLMAALDVVRTAL